MQGMNWKERFDRHRHCLLSLKEVMSPNCCQGTHSPLSFQQHYQLESSRTSSPLSSSFPRPAGSAGLV